MSLTPDEADVDQGLASDVEPAGVDAWLHGRLGLNAAWVASGGIDAAALGIPSRPAIVVFLSDAGVPVQVIATRDARSAVRNRLGEATAAVGPSRRADLRPVVRSVAWRRVDGAFEADWAYVETLKRLGVKQKSRGEVAFPPLDPAWFVHVNPETTYPRFVRTVDLRWRTGTYFGPLAGKADATKLVEIVQDLFDLCRFHGILIRAPHGAACAYKQMGKCPAPCDGSIALDAYRQVVRWATETLADPTPTVQDAERRMRDAAAALRFESAAKVKRFVDDLRTLRARPFRHLRASRAADGWRSFDGWVIGPGSLRGSALASAKLFHVTAGGAEEVGGVSWTDARSDPEGVAGLRVLMDGLTTRRRETSTLRSSPDPRLIAIFTKHLFQPVRYASDAFLWADDVTDATLREALRAVRRQSRPEVEGISTTEDVSAASGASGSATSGGE